jgi:3-methyladenine DNA glycosylase AlkD
MPSYNAIAARIDALGDPQRAAASARYFKTGPGEYAEGDKFVGLELRDANALVKDIWRTTTLDTCVQLLQSGWHEYRTIALAVMVQQFAKGDVATCEAIVTAYLANTARINNWDLVDMSAYKILGPWLETRDRAILYRLVKSPLIWERRIAILTTLHFIKQGDFADALALSEALLGDRHDLMHKATGWMLREVGKKDEATLLAFLDRHTPQMPRTALRYAIEKLTPDQRRHYMAR